MRVPNPTASGMEATSAGNGPSATAPQKVAKESNATVELDTFVPTQRPKASAAALTRSSASLVFESASATCSWTSELHAFNWQARQAFAATGSTSTERAA